MPGIMRHLAGSLQHRQRDQAQSCGKANRHLGRDKMILLFDMAWSVYFIAVV
jgi:hypothetical protein